MAIYWGPANGAGNQLKLNVTVSQSVAGNYSDVRAILSYVGQWAASDNAVWNIHIAGAIRGSWGPTYLSLGTGETGLGEVTYRVGHRADGTQAVSFGGSLNMPFAGFGLSVDGTMTLPSIPRQPSAPSKPIVDSETTSSMRVRFSHQGSIPATKFQLQRATTPNFSDATTVSSSGTTTFTSLSAGTIYYFRARSGNASGWSGWSSSAVSYTLPSAKSPYADTITATSMRIQFGRNGNAAGSTTWELQRATNSGFTTGVTTVASSGTTTVTNLTPGTTYYFRARGKNVSGTGPWSSTRVATTLSVAAPSLGVLSGATGAAADVKIVAPPGVSVTSYLLEAEYLSPLPKPAGADKSLTVTSLNVNVTGLRPGATYRWRVRANIGSYATGWSAWVTRSQLNPNTLDAEYFDSSFTTAADGRTYGSQNQAGVMVSIENAFYPEYWFADRTYLSMRKLNENLVPSRTSTASARFKVIRTITADITPRPFVRLTGPFSLSPIGMRILGLAQYTAMLTMRASGTVNVEFYFEYYSQDNSQTGESPRVAATLIGGADPIELRTFSDTPEWAWKATLRVEISSAAHGTLIDMDGGFLGLGRPERYFDGSTANLPNAQFSWEGTAYDSVSLRTPIEGDSLPDPFADPNNPAPPTPPKPPVPPSSIPAVTTWRRYFSPLNGSEVSQAFESLPTFTIRTNQLADGPVRIQLFENPDNLSATDFVPEEPVSTQIISYLPANSEAVLDGVSERSYGRLDGTDEFSDIDHLVVGNLGSPTTWPVLGCGTPYMIVIDVPSTSPIGNVELEATLTTRMG